jgi:hypothetical protein
MNKHFRELIRNSMMTGKLNWLLVVIAVSLFSIGYLNGIKVVPFHPDETTQIFMSADFFTLFNHPLSLAWTPEAETSLAVHYRLVDPPLTRYMIGFGEWLSRIRPILSDWNWSLSWEANQSNGALPGPHLLAIARWSVAILFPLSLLLAYDSARRYFRTIWAGWFALLLTASNALVLLHTRRAMAESALFCLTLLTLWSLVKFSGKRQWLAAIPAALAFNAKYSAVFLIFLVGLRIVFSNEGQTERHNSLWEKALRLFQAGTILIFLTVLLNPFMWKQPLAATGAALQERAALSAQQASLLPDTDQSQSDLSTDIASFLSSAFIARPAIQDVGNYQKELESPAQVYFANQGTSLLRSITGGAIFLLIFLSGMGSIWLERNQPGRKSALLLLIGFLLTTVFNHTVFVVYYQRYIMAELPYILLISAGFLGTLIAHLVKKFAAGNLIPAAENPNNN